LKLELLPTYCIFDGPEPPIRKVKADFVSRLAESIKEIGLLNPISVYAVHSDPPLEWSHNGNHYSIMAGRNRFAACRSLGWAEIPVLIFEKDDIDRELVEIDENLIRANLSELEESQHTRRREALYLAKYPETGHGGDRKSEGWKNQVTNSATCSPKPSFVKDTAQKTGVSERAVRQSLHRAKAIDSEVQEAIADMPEIADKGVELDALAAMKPEDQRAAVQAVKTGQARNVREATQAKDSPRSEPGKRQQILENAAKKKMETILAGVHGLCRGLPGLNVSMLRDFCKPKEIKEWVEYTHDLSSQLMAFADRLADQASQKGAAPVTGNVAKAPKEQIPVMLSWLHDFCQNLPDFDTDKLRHDAGEDNLRAWVRSISDSDDQLKWFANNLIGAHIGAHAGDGSGWRPYQRPALKPSATRKSRARANSKTKQSARHR
jgi:ParB-like chromosome segregation protein Spo0J